MRSGLGLLSNVGCGVKLVVERGTPDLIHTTQRPDTCSCLDGGAKSDRLMCCLKPRGVTYQDALKMSSSSSADENKRENRGSVKLSVLDPAELPMENAELLDCSPASLAFSPEQVACVCEALLQGNVERLARFSVMREDLTRAQTEHPESASDSRLPPGPLPRALLHSGEPQFQSAKPLVSAGYVVQGALYRSGEGAG
ncbi:hypothetical protein cypCar_00003167 [Cyprinus carpio]|nr:hypothetical protein cypCar_00003167 [Cyprinus carpio]